jgi:uncharacterized protein
MQRPPPPPAPSPVAGEAVDSHTHIFPEHVAERAVAALSAAYGAKPVALPTVPELIRRMDEAGIDRAVVLPVATRPDQVPSINKWFISLQENPRLIPFGALHPHLADCAAEVRRLCDAGIRGVKLQPHFQEFDLDEPATERMWEAIGDRLAVVLHAGQEIAPIERVRPTPTRIRQLAERFPALRLIVAHMGGYRQWDEAEAELVGANVHLDLSYTFGHISDEQILRMVRTHGPERIVWGSDFPWGEPRDTLAAFRRLGLAEADERRILAANLLALLGLK